MRAMILFTVLPQEKRVAILMLFVPAEVHGIFTQRYTKNLCSDRAPTIPDQAISGSFFAPVAMPTAGDV
jgi:hypothetical protein